MSNKITQQQAEAVLAAVKAQFAAYLEPITLDGGRVIAGDPPPTLVMDYEDVAGRRIPAILWEDGPGEWADRASMGGTSEEERVLVAQAAEEFGVPYVKPADDEPVPLPAGVTVEPIYSFVLGIYAA